MPLQAGAAVRGSAPAFDALAESRLRLTRVLEESDLAQGSDESAAGWTAMLEQSQSVLDGREAALKAQQAAAAVRELTPQLLTALANTVKALDPPRPASAPQFERFELRAQAVDQDLSALADGTSPVEAASRRLTDSLDYMGRVTAALAGERNALDIEPAPPAASGAVRLLSTVFQNEQGQVRGVIALGDQLEQMQAARNALAESGTALYAGLADSKPFGAGILGWLARPWLPLFFITVTLLALAYAALLQRSLSRAARTSAISRRSCACWTSCRAWPTVTSRSRPPSPRTSPGRSPIRSISRSRRCASS
jgi:hypothetical protein